MKVFKEKTFGKKLRWIAEGAKGAFNPVGIASLGVGSAGLYLNYKNKKANEASLKQSKKQHEQLIHQQERLIAALGGVEKGLQDLPKEGSERKKNDHWLSIKGKKIFSAKEKNFGIVTTSAFRGAALGAALGKGFGVFRPGNLTPRSKEMAPLLGAALGAVAGSIWGIVKTIDTVISQGNTGHQLVKEVIKNLERAGYKRNQDWTTDPKYATQSKTKVCIVVSKKADELGLLVNMVNDPNLKQVSSEVLSSLPEGAQKTEKFSDRFNDLQISSTPSSGDAVYVFSIIEKFIKRGFPVYLVEVG